ncbi:hypothetical protein GCM10027067_02600 [Pseudactinotalea suaedae]
MRLDHLLSKEQLALGGSRAGSVQAHYSGECSEVELMGGTSISWRRVTASVQYYPSGYGTAGRRASPDTLLGPEGTGFAPHLGSTPLEPLDEW